MGSCWRRNCAVNSQVQLTDWQPGRECERGPHLGPLTDETQVSPGEEGVWVNICVRAVTPSSLAGSSTGKRDYCGAGSRRTVLIIGGSVLRCPAAVCCVR